jgi:hypothetical protein
MNARTLFSAKPKLRPMKTIKRSMNPSFICLIVSRYARKTMLNTTAICNERLHTQTGIPHDTLRQQLNRDAKKPKRERRYPHAYKTACCGAWMIPARDLNKGDK